MDDREYIRTHLINQKVHRHFAGRFSGAADLIAPHIDDNHVLGPHESFIAARRGAHDVSIRQPHADVPIHGGNVLLLIDQMTELCNVFSDAHRKNGHSTTEGEGEGEMLKRLA